MPNQSPQTLVAEEEQRSDGGPIINDFSIQVATVNGSGSQSSNTVLMRSIFQMGIPVSGKNLFPSNIAGLPTWFTIRANKDGWIARRKEIDFLIGIAAARGEAVERQTRAQVACAIDCLGAEFSEAGRVAVEAGGDASVGLRFEPDACIQPGGNGRRRDFPPSLFRGSAQSGSPFRYAEGMG